MISVSLTEDEFRWAVMVGAQRRAGAIVRHLFDPLHHAGKENWRRDIEGAIGELVFARACNRYWTAALNPNRHTGDFPGVDVRFSSRPDAALIVHRTDLEHLYYVLVVGSYPDYGVVGWARGTEAKRDRFWRPMDAARGIVMAAYFVPQSELHPIGAHAKRRVLVA